MNFSTYLIEMTGLSIYDFSVLEWGPFTEAKNIETVYEFLQEWLEYGPSEQLKERASKGRLITAQFSALRHNAIRKTLYKYAY